jgi:hypothetical protein
MKVKKFIMVLLFSIICIYNIFTNEPKVLLQNILINNSPEYFYWEDDFKIIGNIYTNNIIYTIIHNRHFWVNGRMSGRLIIFNDYKIIGQYGIINEIPEIINNKIAFKNTENIIDLANGIPDRIFVDGELYIFDYKNVSNEIIFYGKIVLTEYYGPKNYGEDIINDIIEKYYTVILYEPIKIFFNGIYKNITEIQLIGNINTQINNDSNYYIYGNPFTAQTGHHHTDIIVTVKKIVEK